MECFIAFVVLEHSDLWDRHQRNRLRWHLCWVWMMNSRQSWRCGKDMPGRGNHKHRLQHTKLMYLMIRHTGSCKCPQHLGKMRPDNSWVITTLQSIAVLAALSGFLVLTAGFGEEMSEAVYNLRTCSTYNWNQKIVRLWQQDINGRF